MCTNLYVCMCVFLSLCVCVLKRDGVRESVCVYLYIYECVCKDFQLNIPHEDIFFCHAFYCHYLNQFTCLCFIQQNILYLLFTYITWLNSHDSLLCFKRQLSLSIVSGHWHTTTANHLVHLG